MSASVQPAEAPARGRAPAPPPAAVQPAEALLRRLEWTVVRRLDGLLQGDYRTLFRGFGLDLADLREYQHHDDVRHIDWNVTARMQTPFVREYTEDRELTAWFLLDLSPSVDFGSNRLRKAQLSTEFVAVVGRLLTRSGNRIGALLYGDRVHAAIPARSGRRQVLHLLAQMQARPAPQRRASTDLAQLLTGAAHTVKRRSLLLVVSDFLSAPGWERPLAQLARRHEVVAVRLVDPLERAMPDLGLVPMQDAETGEQMLVDTGDAGFRRRFARLAEQREAALREALGAAGVDGLELATDEDMAEALLRFAHLRKQVARGGGASAGGRA